MMSFRTACLTASTLWGLLFLTLLFIPGLAFWLFQIPPNESVSFFARRAAMLFLGLTAIMFCLRNATDHAIQRVICIGAIASMGGLAVLGLFEFVRGFAGLGIWVAIVVEVGLCAVFAQCMRKN